MELKDIIIYGTILLIIVIIVFYFVIKSIIKDTEIANEIISRYNKLINDTYDINILNRILCDLESEVLIDGEYINVSLHNEINSLFLKLNIKKDTILKIEKKTQLCCPNCDSIYTGTSNHKGVLQGYCFECSHHWSN